MVEVYRLSWSCSHSHSVEYHLKDLEVGLGLALALVVASACEKYWAGLANDIHTPQFPIIHSSTLAALPS